MLLFGVFATSQEFKGFFAISPLAASKADSPFFS